VDGVERKLLLNFVVVFIAKIKFGGVWFRKTRVGTTFLTKSVTVLNVTITVMLEFMFGYVC